MANDSFHAGATGTGSPMGGLDRCVAVPKLVGDPNDFLIVAGLAGTARDMAQICEPNPNYYALAGVMGGATAMGLGLALAQPAKRVLVITGDGELLMNLGSLATVAIMNPPNLSMVCVDNNHYGETGYQKSHTARGVNLAAIASGAGIAAVRVVTQESEIADASALIRQMDGTSFVLLKVAPTDPPKLRGSLDATWTKHRFRNALLGTDRRRSQA
jgi:thiamine pyrophosphate-dependent acetolactate synthase large subunit-like protein